jgi:hypothetical protein
VESDMAALVVDGNERRLEQAYSRPRGSANSPSTALRFASAVGT